MFGKYLRAKTSYFPILCVLQLCYPEKTILLELPNNHVNESRDAFTAGNYSTFGKFPLRKCHCGANSVWQNGSCFPSNTSVELILGFLPSMLLQLVDTSSFDDVIVRDVACNTSMIPASLNKVAFTTRKTLFHLESGENFTKFCVEHVVDKDGKVVVEASVCLPPLDVPSCCPPQHYLDFKTNKCYRSKNISFHPPVRIFSSLINSSNIVPYVQKFPECNPRQLEKKILDSVDGATLQYQQSTVILFEWEGIPFQSIPYKFRQPTDFCVGVEIFLERSASHRYLTIAWDEWSSVACNNLSTDNVDISERQCEGIMYWILLPLLILSTIFLIAILGLRAFIPELRKSLGSKITTCHISSLLAGFIILLVLHIPQNYNCKVYGPLVQCLFLAAFFWLNVMCFDIWWKLRCHNPAGESIQSSRRRFMYYSIYAWASPAVIGIITVTIDNVPDMPSWVIRPGFGQRSCWFAGHDSAMVYYFSIIAFLMGCNIFFFAWVFTILVRANCTYNKVLKNNARTSSSRTWIYVKIFSVMGVTWICEFLSWEEGTCKYWIITDIVNALRGCVLFVIFFGNRKSINKIRERFAMLHQNLYSRFSRSVDSLRKLSMRPHSSFDIASESRRTSETCTELSNRMHPQENENG